MSKPVRITDSNMSAANVQCSISPSLVSSSIKQEKRDEHAKNEKLSQSQPTSNTPITFSITNILSKSFGHTKLSTNNNQIILNNNEVISEKKNSVLFRPYDNDCGDNSTTSPSQPKMDRQQQSEDEESNGKLTLLLFISCRYIHIIT